MSGENASTNKTILHWLNSAKGIGVILVVLGHLMYDSNLHISLQFFYSFHMPLFFIISGYLQKDIRKGFVKKRAQRLLIPFFVFAIVGLPIFGLRLMRHGAGLLSILFDSFYVRGIITNNPLWFLVVLFEISVLIAITNFPQREIKYQLCAYIVTVIVGWLVYMLPEDFILLNLFGINRMIVCSSFYILGILLGKIQPKTVVLLAIVSLIINVIFGILINTKISIYSFELGRYYAFQVAAISGSIAVMTFCKICLDREGFLENISRYAILFMGSQYFAIVPFKVIMRKMHLAETMWYNIAMVIFTMIFILIIPLIYEWLKKRLSIIKVMNGELA